jgi:hypothetical protein
MRRVNSKWITRKETAIYCIDFSSLGADQEGLMLEITASDEVLKKQADYSLLAALDLHHTSLMAPIAQFINQISMPHSPFRKIAFVGVSDLRRAWYSLARGVRWPKNAAFFDDYEQAKDWLVSEGF